MIMAVTGGTGFVGSRLLDLAVADGHEVRALTRRAQPARPKVQWIEGSLEDSGALRRLVDGVDAVIHVAGVVNAPTQAGFEAGNVEGTRRLLDATKDAGTRRFVHVSSLAAREPQLSVYGGSKARGEQLVIESDRDWVIVRPPAVYGPGDREMLELFKAASIGCMPLPPEGRLSLVHVDDLGRLLLRLAEPDAPSGSIFEADDGHSGGYSHREFAQAIGRALERRPLLLPLPAAVLRAGARIDKLLRRDKAKLTPDRAAYFCHPDWVSNPSLAPPPELWRPAIDAAQGLTETADWYCANDWL